MAQGVTTHHHLNVTLGQDKFQHVENNNGQNDYNTTQSGLPNIGYQSGSSSKLKAQLGNEYVGLSLKNKHDRLGSVDFNV